MGLRSCRWAALPRRQRRHISGSPVWQHVKVVNEKLNLASVKRRATLDAANIGLPSKLLLAVIRCGRDNSIPAESRQRVLSHIDASSACPQDEHVM